MSFLKDKRTWIFIAAGFFVLFLFAVIAALIGFGAYFLGRYQERQSWSRLQNPPALSEHSVAQNDRRNPRFEIPNANRRPNFQEAPPHGASEDHVHKPNSPQSAPPGPGDDIMQELSGLMGSGSGGDENGMPSLGSLEAMLGKVMPGQDAGPPPTPSDETLALVKVGKDNGGAAVRKYFKNVNALLAAQAEMTPQTLLGEMKAGQTTSLDRAMADLKKSLASLQDMQVPPKCKEVHAYYLTLIPNLLTLMEAQKKGVGGDMEGLLESFMNAQKVIALQKHIKKLEDDLLISS